MSEGNVNITSSKSTCMCDSCVTIKSQSLIKNNHKGNYPWVECSPYPIRDNNCPSVQPEAVHLNGLYTMEMVKSLLEMVAKRSNEVHLLKADSAAVKFQLYDLHQVRSCVIFTKRCYFIYNST
jgi:hypothetical protein